MKFIEIKKLKYVRESLWFSDFKVCSEKQEDSQFRYLKILELLK